MEYPWRAPQKSPSWFTPDFKIVNGNLRVPTTPGMGLEIDPDFLKAATVIAKIDQPTKSTASGARSGG
jgi:L-alanine-DL-glutamate epimerase-like enolase superfamily enzyme